MTASDTPKDGDFAAYLERKAQAAPGQGPGIGPSTDAPMAHESPSAPSEAKRQTINDVLVNGEEPTEEFLEEVHALEAAPELSDEELERQALQHPGADGDNRTPE